MGSAVGLAVGLALVGAVGPVGCFVVGTVGLGVDGWNVVETIG